jgi:hypothetical protein
VETGTACVACGGPASYFGPRQGYTYVRCASCGSIQLTPIPGAEDLARAYRDDYARSGHIDRDPVAWTAAAGPHYSGVLRTLLAHGARGRVIDFGGGWGGLCRLMLDAGLDARVVEASAEMADYCARAGIPVTHGGLETLGSGEASAMVLVGVFEHLHDHAAWLERAHDIIKPGGLLVVMQPTARCAAFLGSLLRLGRKDRELPALHQTFCPPWHTALFSIGGMTRLAESKAFRLVEVRPGLPGNARGWLGIAQGALQLVNRIGWAVAGEKWPLCVTHIFVFRRV